MNRLESLFYIPFLLRRRDRRLKLGEVFALAKNFLMTYFVSHRGPRKETKYPCGVNGVDFCLALDIV